MSINQTVKNLVSGVFDGSLIPGLQVTVTASLVTDRPTGDYNPNTGTSGFTQTVHSGAKVIKRNLTEEEVQLFKNREQFSGVTLTVQDVMISVDVNQSGVFQGMPSDFQIGDHIWIGSGEPYDAEFEVLSVDKRSLGPDDLLWVCVCRETMR